MITIGKKGQAASRTGGRKKKKKNKNKK